MKLENSIEFIHTNDGFIMVDVNRYIDLKNLNKYNIKQLKSICYQYRIFLLKGRKSDYINLIVKKSDEIVKNNKLYLREKNLNSLFAE